MKFAKVTFLHLSVILFKARLDPLFACFVTCIQQTPQIHRWCDICDFLAAGMVAKLF